jgi:hypothetical protein
VTSFYYLLLLCSKTDNQFISGTFCQTDMNSVCPHAQAICGESHSQTGRDVDVFMMYVEYMYSSCLPAQPFCHEATNQAGGNAGELDQAG